MKIHNTDNLTQVSTISIFVIWLVLTISLLWGFSNELLFQLLFGIVGGVTFECLHLWSLIKTKTFWKDPEKRRPYLIMYILMAAFTVLAAVSFSGKTINAFAKSNDDSRMVIVTLKDKIDANKAIIAGYTSLQIKYAGDTNKVQSFNYTVKQNKELTATNDILISQYQDMLTNKNINKKSEASDAFEFYANVTHLSKSWIIIILLILFFGSIEYGFFLSAPVEDRKLIVTESKEELLKYIDSLFQNVPSPDGTTKTKFFKDEDISKATTIPLTKCKEFRKMISGRANEDSIIWKGTPLITIKAGPGGAVANFTKENMKAIIMNKANLS